jgi:acetylornithine deacetylase/succinyl-diaminopimelate desuccinylase-like protein
VSQRQAIGSTVENAELDELVALLRDLIRIKSVNPPGDEILAARYIEKTLAAEGIPSTVVEPFPGRGSLVARLRGDGTGGDPLLLLSHTDVVPAEPEGWTHDPFGAEMADGFVYGRGTVDMKAMVAMEIQVMRRLARAARAQGKDPASEPIPGLRRDVIFAATADEEAGGLHGAGWIVDNHPEWLRAAAALNEAGAIRTDYAGIRFYPIQVAEKGFVVYKIKVRGVWGHGSVPTQSNAAVTAAQVVTRLAEPGPPRLTRTVSASLERALPHLAANAGGAQRAVRGLMTGQVGGIDATLRELCDPVLARTVSAMIRDTVSVGVIRAGVKYNVIPGVAEIELDCRVLPGTSEEQMRTELRRRIGDELWAKIEVTCEIVGLPAEAPLDGEMYPLLESVVRRHDPEGVPLPFLAPWATDAKHLARIGVPVYGFSPLYLGEDAFLGLMHATDERVSVEALRFGLPVLWDAVAEFCGAPR